jgi:hypothetical protein
MLTPQLTPLFHVTSLAPRQQLPTSGQLPEASTATYTTAQPSPRQRRQQAHLPIAAALICIICTAVTAHMLQGHKIRQITYTATCNDGALLLHNLCKLVRDQLCFNTFDGSFSLCTMQLDHLVN